MTVFDPGFSEPLKRHGWIVADSRGRREPLGLLFEAAALNERFRFLNRSAAAVVEML